MNFSKTGLMVAALMSLAVAGCQSERMTSLDTTSSRPAPLAAAPTGRVTGSQLPPPASPQTQDPSQFPTAPQQVASATPAVTEPLATAPDLSAGSVAGVWTASVAGQSCKVATPQTKFGAGFRAGPLHCPAPMDGIKSWNVAGKQLTLHDTNGSVLARLYATGPEKFDGQTASGVPISLSR
ncbi:AprI/Inh family metalloprotease inhibitor [Mesorhizobium sp. NBSH29]|uniref:AprI/Inh family metalloprotease inhibitor n=1 Tax=Mesorhizobium sp. NBSH29 TaxID=2654249 RepID=UPI0018968304|nr:AprI/Inh family metalloprotease inhibitor [Mesorhizobium sp. NBSH29]QPC86025.1 AprI/Inh family metalloprotease inhibitor [Mesorhizobium sp. NBSH29]